MKSYDNIFLNQQKDRVDYRYKGRRINIDKIMPDRDRLNHGTKLINRIKSIRDKNKNKKVISLEKYDGFYLDFESSENFNLEIKSLEAMKSNIRLMNVRYDNELKKEMATIFIPKGKENVLLNKIKNYCDESKDVNGKIKNRSLVESIESIKEAVIESFWIGNKEKIPTIEREWCEFWLRSDLDEDIEYFRNVCIEEKIQIKKELLKFPERSVVLVFVNRENIEFLIDKTNLVAEIRKAVKIDNFFYTINNYDQVEWAEDLRDRCTINNDSNVCISILDYGVNNKHLLLKDILKDEDVKVYNS